MTERTNDGYGAALIHFDNNQELHDIVIGLVGCQRLYAELAWIDSVLEEIREIESEYSDDIFHSPKIVELGIEKLLAISRDKDFDPEYPLRGTQSALRVATARDGGSWVVELIGKLNPIEALHKILVLVRDWQSTKERNRLKNSQLAQEVIALQLENQVREIGVLGDAIHLLEVNGLDSDEVSELIRGRLSNVVQSSTYINYSVKQIDVISTQKEAESPTEKNVQASIREVRAENEQRLAVWDRSNKLVHNKDDI